MQAAKTCLVALSLAFVVGCNSQSFPSGISKLPTPSIVSFSPGSTPQRSPDILVNIEGKHFLPNGTDAIFFPAVLWSTNGGQSSTFLETTQRSDTHITAEIPAALLMRAGKATLQVQIYRLDGDTPKATSNTVDFTVTD